MAHVLDDCAEGLAGLDLHALACTDLPEHSPAAAASGPNTSAHMRAFAGLATGAPGSVRGEVVLPAAEDAEQCGWETTDDDGEVVYAEQEEQEVYISPLSTQSASHSSAGSG